MRTWLASVVVVALASPVHAQPDVAAAREANREGLREHQRERYESAQELFARAVELDPSSAMARFNLACATAKLGDLPGAAEHVAEYVRMAPDQAVRVLHDADLEDLWKDDALLAALRAQIRPAGSEVREIVFERREEGDLWAVTHDGLDVLQLTDTELHEMDVRFAMDGRYLVFRTLEGLVPTRVYYMLDRALPNLQLRVMEYPAGPQRTVDEGVYEYRLLGDGRTLLYPKTVPPSQRRGRAELPRDLRRADVEGGEPVTLGPVGFGRLCYGLAPDGSAVVAEGRSVGWGTLSLTVARLVDGERTVLFERPPHTYRELRAFTRCALSEDGETLDLGPVIVRLDGEVRAEPASVNQLAGLYVTLPEQTYEECEWGSGEGRTPPPEWAVSPMSWTESPGESDCIWFATTHVHRYHDGTLERVSGERAYIEYAPALAPAGDLLVRTRLRSRTSRPWLILSDPSGGAERPVAPGQFAVWSPHVHTVREAGAPIELGPGEPDDAEPDRAPVEMTPAAGGATPAVEESSCGCAVVGDPRGVGAGPWTLLLLVPSVRRSSYRRRRARTKT
jgi:hypothetical protein